MVRSADAGPVPVRVLIAVDKEVLRAGVATLIRLRPGFTVTEMPAGRAGLMAEVRAQRPDVLLADITMGDSLRELLDARGQGGLADVAVLALATEDPPDMEVLRDLVQRGVDGIVTANDQASQLSGAMQAVRGGRRWLSPSIAGHLLDALAHPWPDPSAGDVGVGDTSLTQRERHVLTLVADGLTVSQIARRLHRSESAVKYHLANLSARYQASNRAHLVYLAVQAGELPVG